MVQQYRISAGFQTAVFCKDVVYSKIHSKSTGTGRTFPEETAATKVAGLLKNRGDAPSMEQDMVIAALNNHTAGQVRCFYGNLAPDRFFFVDTAVSALDKLPALC
jgi:hypothetical protein